MEALELEKEAEEANNEQSYGNNTLEERVDHLEKCICEMSERLTYFIHDTVDEVQAIKNHAAHQDTLMQKKCVHVDSAKVEPMNELKRTNKDVLLAVFPDVRMEDSGIPTVCPLSLDKHYNCSKFKDCKECRRAYWLAEEDE